MFKIEYYDIQYAFLIVIIPNLFFLYDFAVPTFFTIFECINASFLWAIFLLKTCVFPYFTAF